MLNVDGIAQIVKQISEGLNILLYESPRRVWGTQGMNIIEYLGIEDLRASRLRCQSEINALI